MLLLEGLSAVHLAKLRRDFRYRAIATRRIITNVIGGVIGVTLAFMGWGVWALVISRLITAASASVILWRATDFRPSFSFSFAHLRSIGRFSTHQLGSQLLGQANRSEEHTSELQSLMRNSYAVFCLKKKKKQKIDT